MNEWPPAERPISARKSGVVEAEQLRAICFYLPQFHPIAENDLWWGAGFTDWRNVVAARPRFRGHYQPHFPEALGFYDLRLQETQVAQAELARQFGISGFCYYHYWFHGRRLLNRPLDQVLSSGQPDFPFCLCWANETWSRTWSGRDDEVLIAQTYSVSDNMEHITWLAGVFSDNRYITVSGRPLLLVYRPDSIPDVKRTMEEWKEQCSSSIGVAPFLCAVRTGFSSTGDPSWGGAFDAIVDFEPSRRSYPKKRNAVSHGVSLSRKFLPEGWYDGLRDNRWFRTMQMNARIDYAAYVDASIARPRSSLHLSFPCLFPSWDNTARRTAPTIIENNSAEQYGRWLADAAERVNQLGGDRRLVFINAWNEWAEGCHLEPDLKNGLAFLEETRRVLQIARNG